MGLAGGAQQANSVLWFSLSPPRPASVSVLQKKIDVGERSAVSTVANGRHGREGSYTERGPSGLGVVGRSLSLSSTWGSWRILIWKMCLRMICGAAMPHLFWVVPKGAYSVHLVGVRLVPCKHLSATHCRASSRTCLTMHHHLRLGGVSATPHQGFVASGSLSWKNRSVHSSTSECARQHLGASSAPRLKVESRT